MGDELAGGGEAIEEAGAPYRGPPLRERAVDLPVQDAVASIDESGRVAEGAGIDRGRARGGRRCAGRVGDRAQLEGSTGRSADRGRASIRATARRARAIWRRR